VSASRFTFTLLILVLLSFSAGVSLDEGRESYLAKSLKPPRSRRHFASILSSSSSSSFPFPFLKVSLRITISPGMGRVVLTARTSSHIMRARVKPHGQKATHGKQFEDNRQGLGRWKADRKPWTYYIERRKQHAAAGRTLPDPPDNTRKLDKSVARKWQR
jgi:hypothetical protein